MHPILVTTLGLLGNDYLLGGLIRVWRDEVSIEMREIQGDLGKIRVELDALAARQRQFNRHLMSVAEELLQERGGIL